jgi:hypothetical protein
VTEDYVRDILGPRCRFKIYPVLDIEGMAPVDAFPFGACTSAEDMQEEHTVPWLANGPPGQSVIGNYGPLTPTQHRIKTHGRWQVRQPFPRRLRLASLTVSG